MAKQLPLVHPGEVLREEFLKPLGWSVSRLAGELEVPVQRINEVVRFGRYRVEAQQVSRNNPGILDERIKPRNPSVHGG